jgi:hypothetical protein
MAIALVAAPAAAQEKKVRVALGYSFLHYLEEGEGNAPLGASLAVGSAGRAVGFELDLAYHHDSEELLGDSLALNTLTAALGPRFELGSGSARPFLHVLGGLRYDRLEGDDSETAFGGMVEGGVDIPIGSGVHLRLAAGYQIFFAERDNLETLRLTAGVAF